MWGAVELREVRIALGRSLSVPEPWFPADVEDVADVLPTYQEAADPPIVVAALFDLSGLRILVVDDNCPDGTGQVGEEAGAKFVVQMDSDLWRGPQYLPQMLGTLLSVDADVVIGSRYVLGGSVGAEWPFHRRAPLGFANAYVWLLLQLALRDATAGYKLWQVSAQRVIGLRDICSDGYGFQVEMNYLSVRHDLNIIERPIHFSDRAEGESKMSLKCQLESALVPRRLRRHTV
jgi:dolichol-phosphate mannosyltransferase